MSVFRRKSTNRKGQIAPDNTYTIEFRDHAEIVRRVPGFASRAASMELERNIRKLVSIRQAGGSPDAESNHFLEIAPAAVRDKLAAWGVIAGERAARARRWQRISRIGA